MASIKILLWNKKNSEGKFPIVLRIIKDRKPSYVYIGHYVDKLEWDEKNARVKKSHPNAARLNNIIAKKYAEANATLLDLEANENDTSSSVIKRTIKGNKKGSFFTYADIYLQTIKEQGKFNRYSADKPRVERFKEFLNNNDIALKDITVQLLKQFKAFLLGNRKVSERTAVNHLVVIRTIFNQAIKAKAVDLKHYPFGKGGITIKFPQSIKIGLTREEVSLLEQLDLPQDSYMHHARNIWLISFYFAGMRVSDVLRLKWSDFQNDRLFYAMGKNKKVDSLKIPAQAQAILNQYPRKSNRHNFVFPDLQDIEDIRDSFRMEKKIAAVVDRLDTNLKKVAKRAKIEKPLTMHIARHTFGNISGDRIPIQMLQKLYRHTSITTTIGYQSNFIHKDADDALEAVIGN